MGAKVKFTMFVDNIRVTYVVFRMVKNDLCVGVCLWNIVCINMQGVLSYEERLQRVRQELREEREKHGVTCSRVQY